MAYDWHFEQQVLGAAALVVSAGAHAYGVLLQTVDNDLPGVAVAKRLRLFAPVSLYATSAANIFKAAAHVDGGDGGVRGGGGGGVDGFDAAVDGKDGWVERRKIIHLPSAATLPPQANATPVKGIPQPLFAKVEICIDFLEVGHCS